MVSTPKDIQAIILAGGRGTRLGALTAEESKPALPFAAAARTIDFPLSNCLHAGIRDIAVVTQYQPQTLSRHLAEVWQPIAARYDARVGEWPASRCNDPCGFVGTADAVHKNRDLRARSGARHVLVLAGDHVYQMDYGAMLRTHLEKRADVTVGCIEVPVDEAHQFGVLAVDDRCRIVRFDEKPAAPRPIPGRPDHALASMGIYLFDADFLSRALEADHSRPGSRHDFGHDVIPGLIHEALVFAHVFGPDAAPGQGYWRDVGTPEAYWRAHMELFEPDSAVVRMQTEWPLLTLPPDTFVGQGIGMQPLIGANTSTHDALIIRSALCDGVVVGADSYVSDSIVLPGAVIGRNCMLHGAIVTANCRIPDHAIVGQPAALRAGRGAEPVVVTPTTCTALARWRVARRAARRSDTHPLRDYA